jgi:hypothetical protein
VVLRAVLTIIAMLTALAAGAPAAAAPFTPGVRELVEALADGGHHARPTHVRCSGFAEEPTEFRCDYRLRDGARCHTFIAIDGSSWVQIDTPTCRRRS